MLVSLFNKVAGLQICNFIKKKLQQRCVAVNIAKFLRTPFLWNTSRGCFYAAAFYLVNLELDYIAANNQKQIQLPYFLQKPKLD